MKQNPLAMLWIGKATISEYQDVVDPETAETTQELVPVVVDEPCRLSHTRESLVNVETGVPYLNQTIVLFIRPDLEISEGSVIEVTQNGYTDKYKRSSKPSIYTNHQEISLELYKENA